MQNKSILIDTSFIIKFLKKDDILFQNARDYYLYFLNNKIAMKVSTISIAEFCIKGEINQLPLNNLQIVPFNINHAIRAGDFARICFETKKQNKLEIDKRNIIPNDTKIFAQADSESDINNFITSDKKCEDIYSVIKNKMELKFNIINLETPPHITFGLLL